MYGVTKGWEESIAKYSMGLQKLYLWCYKKLCEVAKELENFQKTQRLHSKLLKLGILF